MSVSSARSQLSPRLSLVRSVSELGAYLSNSRKTVRVSLTDRYAYFPFLLFLNYIGMRLGVGQRVFFESVFRRIIETSELRTVLWENPDFYLCSEVSFTTSTKHMDLGYKK